MRHAVTIAVAAALVLFAGCESTEKTEAASQATTQVSMGTLNETCPMTGADVNPDVTTDYFGQKIGFCCADCQGTWDGWSEDRKAKYVATLN